MKMSAAVTKTVVDLTNKFNKMALQVRNTTAALKSGQPTIQILTTLLLNIDVMFPLHNSICKLLECHTSDWAQHHAHLRKTPEGEDILSAYAACTTALAAYLDESFHHLQRLAAMPSSALSAEPNQNLWLMPWKGTCVLCDCCPLWSDYGSPFLTDNLVAWVPMLASFYTWLLPFTRQQHCPQQILACLTPLGMAWQEPFSASCTP